MQFESPNPTMTAEKVHALLSEAVSGGSSLFGRLVSVAVMREGGGASVALGAPAETVDRELRRLHRTVFQEWLELSLAEQRRDLAAYLRTAPGGRGLLSTIVDLGMSAVPPERREVEAKLFFQDLSTVQSSLMVDAAGFAPAKPEPAFRRAPVSLPALG